MTNRLISVSGKKCLLNGPAKFCLFRGTKKTKKLSSSSTTRGKENSASFLPYLCFDIKAFK